MDYEYSLLLEGDPVEIQRFVKQAEYKNKKEALITDFSFRKFIQTPKEMSDEWEWCKENWGVDWENQVYYNAQKQTYYFHYDDSLVPSIRGFLVVSKQFPHIKFTFEYYDCTEEVGLVLHGKIEFREGIIMSEEKSRERVTCCSCCGSIKSHEKIK